MLYFESPSTDPYFNLALEQHLFDTVGQTRAIFMLWQNDNTIVVGRHQNTAEEVNADFVKEHGVKVVRRLSGGGAVYHDLGNLNFTFIAAAGSALALDLQMFCRPVAQALGELGVVAELTGRNDIAIDGQKFSGNAQYKKNGRVMHHGTIMFDSDLDVLSHALKVAPDKIATKGVTSVRGRVTNVRAHLPQDGTLEEFKRVLVRSIFATDAPPVYALTDGDIQAVNALRESRYATWEWNYGASPKYDLRKERRIDGVGKVAFFLQVKDGRIAAVEVRGDFFGEGETAGLSAALLGCPLEELALSRALANVDVERCVHHLTPAQLCQIILT